MAKNQCDGCMAGHPLDEYGIHKVRTSSGYNNGMVCQAAKYGCKPFEAVGTKSCSACGCPMPLNTMWCFQCGYDQGDRS